MPRSAPFQDAHGRLYHVKVTPWKRYRDTLREHPLYVVRGGKRCPECAKIVRRLGTEKAWNVYGAKAVYTDEDLKAEVLVYGRRDARRNLKRFFPAATTGYSDADIESAPIFAGEAHFRYTIAWLQLATIEALVSEDIWSNDIGTLVGEHSLCVLVGTKTMSLSEAKATYFRLLTTIQGYRAQPVAGQTIRVPKTFEVESPDGQMCLCVPLGPPTEIEKDTLLSYWQILEGKNRRRYFRARMTVTPAARTWKPEFVRKHEIPKSAFDSRGFRYVVSGARRPSLLTVLNGARVTDEVRAAIKAALKADGMTLTSENLAALMWEELVSKIEPGANIYALLESLKSFNEAMAKTKTADEEKVEPRDRYKVIEPKQVSDTDDDGGERTQYTTEVPRGIGKEEHDLAAGDFEKWHFGIADENVDTWAPWKTLGQMEEDRRGAMRTREGRTRALHEAIGFIPLTREDLALIDAPPMAPATLSQEERALRIESAESEFRELRIRAAKAIADGRHAPRRGAQ